VTVDGRERADISGQHPEVLAELREAWERIDAELLPFPTTHVGLPRPRTEGAPAVSEPD